VSSTTPRARRAGGASRREDGTRQPGSRLAARGGRTAALDYNRPVARTSFGGAGRAVGGIVAALKARRTAFLLAAGGVFLLDICVPPVVLSLARKPVDFFTFNPWLPKLPEYLASGPGSLAGRLEKAWGLALFWFSSDNPYGIEWGFAVTVADLARFALMSLVIAAYFALWLDMRARLGPGGWGGRASANGGIVGACSSVFGLATGGCTVMGCGAPVMPVIGLAFAGLSSTTLTWMSKLSLLATPAVLLMMGTGVLYLGWRLSAPGPAGRG
jgi:hypothetical protein